MTNAQFASLDRQLRARETYAQRGINPPPHMSIAEIAKRFNLTEEQVIARLRVLNTP